MLDVREALKSVLSCRLHSYSVTVPLGESLSRILAEDILADLDQPPFNRVTMDGIAINKALLNSTKKFKIIRTVSAGSEQVELPAGEFCFEIMTGAVLPRNSDMVIRYEDLKIVNGFAEVIVDAKQLSTNFHPQGSDYRKGDQVLFKNSKIRSTTTALLASVGKSKVVVYNIPKVAILSTGDELVDIEAFPKPHQIRWSNGISLKQELLAHGFSDVTLYKVNDDEAEMKKVMLDLIKSKDVLLLTGGVSAGKFDFVPQLLKECKVNEIFHKVAQRPGKPLWFGKTDQEVFVFGLPGNPVSCLVSLRKYVIPFLGKNVTATAFLGADVKSNTGLTYYCPVKVKNEEGRMVAYPLPGNGSGDFFQLRDSDGFIELNPGNAPFTTGSIVELFLWGHS